MNINYRVVGLDPGGTTGWFQYDAEFEFGKLLGSRVEHRHFGPHEHHDELFEALEAAIESIADFYLVWESFEYRNYRHRDNLNLMSKEYIGVAKLFRKLNGLNINNRAFEFTAGQSKGFIPDKAKNGLSANAKLKAIPGFYNPGMKHANDAARVTALFLISKQDRKDLVEYWKDL